MNLPLSGHVHFVQSEEAHRTVLQGQSTGVNYAEVDACKMCKFIDLTQEVFLFVHIVFVLNCAFF